MLQKINKKDCFIIGTRPEVIKMAPLILKSNPFIIYTGQHKELAKEMFSLFEIVPDMNLNLMKKNQTLIDFMSRCMKKLDKEVRKRDFDRIWVYGDTSSAFAGSLVSFFNKIPLVHIEAGLRTFDKNNPFPEEAFRVFIDRVSDYQFVPTTRALRNLKKEQSKSKAFVVGNTVVDALEIIKKKLPNKSPINEKYILATIHRRESFGNDMYEIFSALKEISKKTKVILPLHPNPNVQKVAKVVGIETVEPMNYIDFLWHMKFCEYIITDSGGIQEEVTSFNKKVIVLRKTTERQEIIENGYGILINKMKKNNILNNINEFLKKNIIYNNNPFGDGHASDKIIKIISDL